MLKPLNTGLNISEIESILSILKKYPKITDAILFGSRAKGNFSNGSDIDIALKGEDLVLNDLLDISTEFDELPLPYKFDLVLYHRIKEIALIEHIDRIGISFFTL